VRLQTTELEGLLVLEPEPIVDERGFFARIWDRDELLARDLPGEIAQCSIAFNEIRGTLRGLHFQEPPHDEAKTVRCTSGAIFDVAVDLRQSSRTKHQWVGLELDAASRRSLFIPAGFAHGYITLTDATEVEYQMSAPFEPRASRGIRWDDETLAISWPIPVARISQRDAELPLLVDAVR